MRYLTPFLALTLAGCFGAMSPPPPGYLAEPDHLTATVAADPSDVIDAATAVLSEWGFGIATVNPDMGIVQTAEKVVQGAWRDGAARDYLYCGKAWDSGVEYALSNPITFTVGVTAREQPGGETLVRLNVNGSAYKKGFGSVQPETHPCQPTAQMADEILEGIRALIP